MITCQFSNTFKMPDFWLKEVTIKKHQKSSFLSLKIFSRITLTKFFPSNSFQQSRQLYKIFYQITQREINTCSRILLTVTLKNPLLLTRKKTFKASMEYNSFTVVIIYYYLIRISSRLLNLRMTKAYSLLKMMPIIIREKT